MIQFVKRDDIFFPGSVFGSFQHLCGFLIFTRLFIPSTTGKIVNPHTGPSLFASARCCATSNMLAAQVCLRMARAMQMGASIIGEPVKETFWLALSLPKECLRGFNKPQSHPTNFDLRP